MVDPTANDNDNDARPGDERSRGPDPHGQAAMLLVESLLHGLIARSVITVSDAFEIVGVATEVEEMTEELGDSPATMQKSLALLHAIGSSLSIDLPDEQ